MFAPLANRIPPLLVPEYRNTAKYRCHSSRNINNILYVIHLIKNYFNWPHNFLISLKVILCLSLQLARQINFKNIIIKAKEENKENINAVLFINSEIILKESYI